MFSSSAHGGAGDGTGLRFSRIGRELQNLDRTSRITTGTTIPTGTATASFVFWHHGSGSTTSDRSNVSRPAEDQGEQGSSDLERHDAEDLNNTGVLQSVRAWTDKTDATPDTWEAAIRVRNAAGAWELAVRTDVSQNHCRVFVKKSIVEKWIARKLSESIRS